MKLNASDFLDNKLESITQNLLKTNGNYSLAAEKCKCLLDAVDPILNRGKDITISAGDCMNLKELFAQQRISAALLQQELYKQGYIDCIQLLKTIGVLG